MQLDDHIINCSVHIFRIFGVGKVREHRIFIACK